MKNYNLQNHANLEIIIFQLEVQLWKALFYQVLIKGRSVNIVVYFFQKDWYLANKATKNISIYSKQW